MTSLPRDLTEEDFHREIMAAPVAALVEFWAAWCPYSRLLPPKLERLQERYGERLRIGRVDVDRYPELVESLKIAFIPALVIFRGGRPQRRLYGDRHLGEIEAHLQRSRVREGA